MQRALIAGLVIILAAALAAPVKAGVTAMIANPTFSGATRSTSTWC